MAEVELAGVAVEDASLLDALPSSEAAAPRAAAAVPYAARFIVWAEFCERFSYYGMRAVLALFFAQRLGLSEAGATVGVHLFIVGCYMSPLVGAALSDGRYGRFATILSLGAVNLGGGALLALAAAARSVGAAVVALALMALGTGGIKPCVAAFGADQIDARAPNAAAATCLLYTSPSPRD